MIIANWKDHILVNCAKCLKPMGYYVQTTEATCMDCDVKATNQITAKQDFNMQTKEPTK